MVFIITLVLLAAVKASIVMFRFFFFNVAFQIIQVNKEKKGDPEGF